MSFLHVVMRATGGLRSRSLHLQCRVIAGLGLMLVPAALAQPEPHAGYAYPAGGRQGTSVTVVVGGQYLSGVTGACVSGTGVRAEFRSCERQLTPKEQAETKEKLATLQDKRKQGQGLTPEEEKTRAELVRTLTLFGRRPANPALSVFVTLQVTLDPDAEPGRRELRLQSALGLSNPLAFCVGQLPEVSSPEWRNLPTARGSMAPAVPAPAEPRITLPCVLNGQIAPGGSGRYRFTARAGQSLVVAVSARELMPYLADAVPGWFQATLTLYDGTGREVAYADDYRANPDPVVFYTVPTDGDYVLEIRDALFRGREDFVYRITVGEQPFVTGVFPLGGQCGTQPSIALSGWNLATTQLRPDLRQQEPGIVMLAAGPASNRVPFAVDALPECLEVEAPEGTSPQTITLPVTINGRIDRPGEWDVFSFAGREGDLIVAEVMARRLGSPLDSTLRLTTADGRLLAANDDHEDRGSGLNTHHADSYLSATLPADATYCVHLGDTQHQGGSTYAYRLRLSAPRPDFELRLVPSSLTLRRGISAPITAYALRKDGFAGAIELSLRNAPPGFELAGARIPADQDRVAFTVSVLGPPPPDPLDLFVQGRAVIQGHDVVRQAVPADDMMQAFAYRHLVPAQELKVAVFGRSRGSAAARVLGPTPVKIPVGGVARVRLSIPSGPFATNLRCELSDPPGGISLQESSLTELVLAADAVSAKPGQQGNLIIKLSAERPPPVAATGTADSSTRAATPRRFAVGSLPAIPFEITAPP